MDVGCMILFNRYAMNGYQNGLFGNYKLSVL